MDAWSCPWCKSCDLCGGTGSIAEYVSFEIGESTLDESLDDVPTPRYFDPIAVTLSSRSDMPSYPPDTFPGKPNSLLIVNIALTLFATAVIVLLAWLV